MDQEQVQSHVVWRSYAKAQYSWSRPIESIATWITTDHSGTVDTLMNMPEGMGFCWTMKHVLMRLAVQVSVYVLIWAAILIAMNLLL